MKNFVILAVLSSLPLAAAAETASPSSTQSSASIAWVAERGTMTTEDVVSALGVAPTAEQRAQIEQAVSERNRALQEANARFSATLQKTLAADDKELARRVADERERRRIDSIRRRQPGRYSGMKKSK